MDTLATCLPLLTGQALPQMMHPDDVQALSGAEFLQMLTSLGTAAMPGDAGASTLPALPTELNMAEIKPPRDEPDVPAEAAMALQWLPLTQFIETGINQRSADAAPAVATEGGDSGLLQTAPTASLAASVLASTAGRKIAAPVDPAAPPTDALPAADTASEEIFDVATFAASMVDVETPGAAPVLVDRPAAGLAGSASLSATAAAINSMHSVGERTQASPPSAVDQPVQAHIRAPVHSARWAQEIAQRITMMSAAGQQNGTLTLTPENMGPLEVRINVSQDTANVWFGAQQADTRAALTDALPRLREMFAANGLSLGEANVSREAPRQDSEAAKAFRGEAGGVDDPGTRDGPRPMHRVSLGIIDTYA